ncbi:hypothetical protein OG21DRAFT_1491549 [Imleria badia]|nr:hypothetical protein OG21DRAFT_1491549 [Imleria badia]
MPSPSPTPEPEENLEIEQVFSVSLIVYSKVKKILRGKATLKEEKTMKTKELSFAVNSSNYTDFLWSMLEKHGQDNYEVTTKKHYPFRYTLLKIKGQHVANAIDVNNIADYKEMVMKINESKPAVIKILIDMRDIQKLP